MQQLNAAYRPRSLSCIPQLSVPQIHINGQPVPATTPPRLSPIITDIGSGAEFSTSYNNPGNTLSDNLSSVASHNPFTYQQPSNHVREQVLIPEYQGTGSPSTSRALSGIGSLHANYQSVPNYRSPALESPSDLVQFHDRHQADPWQFISHDNAMSSFPQSLVGSSSNHSDDFSIVDQSCSNCKSQADTVENLKAQIAQLRGEVCSFQQALRKQHTVITTQQRFIEGLRNVRQVEVENHNRKRSWPVSQKDINGSEVQPEDETAVPSPVAKRGRFAPHQRKQTAETRRQGACVRCWKHKQRCDPGDTIGGPCKNCQDPSLGVIRLPCIRTHIVDLNIFRCSMGINVTWTRRDEVEKPMDLTTYVSETRKHLELTHGYGPTLRVNVRPYHPVRDDATEYVWQDDSGITQRWELPPYALCDTDDLTSTIQYYIRENQNVYIASFIPKDDVPTFEAFRVAQKLAAAETSPLLQDVLDLWMAARLIEKPWQICGEETLGLHDQQRWWWIPVTPIMDTQLDQIVTKRFLLPLRKKVLHGLQVQIEKAARKGLLEILVTIVILLNTLEEATRHDQEFATFFGHEFRPGKRRFGDYDLIEGYFHSALTLLTHVKVAFDGRLPYLDADSNVSKLMNACQEGDEKDYMIKTDRYVNKKDQGTYFEQVRQNHQYEERQFWVHQLFVKQWEGQPIAIREKS